MSVGVSQLPLPEGSREAPVLILSALQQEQVQLEQGLTVSPALPAGLSRASVAGEAEPTAAFPEAAVSSCRHPPLYRRPQEQAVRRTLMKMLRQEEALETKAQQCLTASSPPSDFASSFPLLLKCLGWFCTEHLWVYSGHGQRSSYGLGKPSQGPLPSGILSRALSMGKRHVANTFQRPHLNVSAPCSFASMAGCCEGLSALGKCAFLHRYGQQTREAAPEPPVTGCPVSALLAVFAARLL